MFRNPLLHTSTRKNASDITSSKPALYATGTPTNLTLSSTINATATQSSPTSTASDCRDAINIPPFMGINFTVYCDSDINQHDLGNSVVSSIEECHQSCLRLPGCFAVTFTFADYHCYRKSSGITQGDIKPNSLNMASILPDWSHFNQTSRDIACPVRNLDTHSTSAGLDFTVLCGATLWGDDLYSPINYQAFDFMHADSLEECLEHCANNHPLCSRVTYDADQNANLWSNCWLKTASSAKPVPASPLMHHSAYAQLPILKPSKCKQNAPYHASDGRIFKTSCMDHRLLNDTQVAPIAISHEPTVDSCMGKCTNGETNCSAITFDVGLQSGYHNCYLFDRIPPPLEQHGDYTFLYHTVLSPEYQPPPSSPWKGLTKAELGVSIALPCSTLLTIFILYWFWWRHRQSSKTYIPVKSD